MSFNHTLSAILRGRWLIDKQWAESHLPLVLLMLKGNQVNFVERDGASEGGELPFVVDAKTMQRSEMYVPTYYGLKRNPNIPENSVGVIPVSGPITKYNGSCGEAGALQYATWLTEMQKADNVGSIVFSVDTPGGEARAANAFVSAIKSSKKPVLSYVDGMAASLGMWLISATQESYVSSKTDEVGSVGSYVTLFDFKGYLEKEGIKMHEIYAPQSTDKNKDYKDALQGDYSAIQNDLAVHVDEFISFIKEQRPQSAANAGEWNTGKMFYAKEAQDLGLIDGVKSFQQVISKASWLGKRNKN